MVDCEEVEQVAIQIKSMLAVLEKLSSVGSLLSVAELEGLRAFLCCAYDCAILRSEGKEDRGATAKLIGKYHSFSEILLATACDGDWGGGVPDLRGVLLNRLFDSEHPYLRLCEEYPPTEVPTVFYQSMRRQLQNLAKLASAPWQDWLQAVGVEADSIMSPLAGKGSESEAVAALKERFIQSDDWGDLTEQLGHLVHEYGRGALRRFAAFRIVGGGKPVLEPIRHFAEFPLDWLEGNEARMQTLEENTCNFLAGYRAHNVLVWGPRGGGKSTLIRALISKYYNRGLRAIEIPPSSYSQLSDLFKLVRGRRQRFIGVLDNISLDRGDQSLHLLSRVLDGGLEEWPDNLVFYATSNYKDLVDREGERQLGLGQMQMDDQQPNLVNKSIQPEFYDPQQLQRLDEERGLDDRFALKVFLDLPRKQQYQKMVLSYARRASIDVPTEDLLASFEVWRMRHNHDLVGGRTVRDFVLAQLPQYKRREED